MRAKLIDNSIQEQGIATARKSWTMVVLTLVFIFLYGSALLEWIRPQVNERIISRLEPIIFAIIGYYFGRLPSQQNERLLKDEINWQMQKADAAQHAKEQAQQTRESLEEKMKNVRTVLATSSSRLAENSDRAGGSVKDDNLRQSVAAALNILNS